MVWFSFRNLNWWDIVWCGFRHLIWLDIVWCGDLAGLCACACDREWQMSETQHHTLMTYKGGTPSVQYTPAFGDVYWLTWYFMLMCLILFFCDLAKLYVSVFRLYGELCCVPDDKAVVASLQEWTPRYRGSPGQIWMALPPSRMMRMLGQQK